MSQKPFLDNLIPPPQFIYINANIIMNELNNDLLIALCTNSEALFFFYISCCLENTLVYNGLKIENRHETKYHANM